MSDSIQPGDMFLWIKKHEVCIVVKKVSADYDGELWQIFTLDLDRYEMEMRHALLNPALYERLA